MVTILEKESTLMISGIPGVVLNIYIVGFTVLQTKYWVSKSYFKK